MKKGETYAWDVWYNGCRIRGPAHHQEGGADGFLVSSPMSDRTYEGARGQQRHH